MGVALLLGLQSVLFLSQCTLTTTISSAGGGYHGTVFAGFDVVAADLEDAAATLGVREMSAEEGGIRIFPWSHLPKSRRLWGTVDGSALSIRARSVDDGVTDIGLYAWWHPRRVRALLEALLTHFEARGHEVWRPQYGLIAEPGRLDLGAMGLDGSLDWIEAFERAECRR
jgi:hypothetical protein